MISLVMDLLFPSFLLSTLYFMFISCRGVVLCRFWFLDLFSFFALIIHCFGTRWRPRSRRGSCYVSHNGYTSREPPKTQNKDHGVRAANFCLEFKTRSDNIRFPCVIDFLLVFGSFSINGTLVSSRLWFSFFSVDHVFFFSHR